MKTLIQKIIIILIAIVIAGILLVLTSYLLFLPKNNHNFSETSTVISTDNSTITILTDQTSQELTISLSEISFFQFDPFKHQNLPQTNYQATSGQKYVVEKTSNDYNFISMPPVQLFGQVTSIDNNTINILSNGNNLTAKISDQTIFLSPEKNLILPDSISIGTFVFIYSDYSAYDNQTTNIPAASVQIINH